MSGRWDVAEDGSIEIMRPLPNGQAHHMKFPDLETALKVIRFHLKRDLQEAAKERFVPIINKEAAKAYRELEARSPYGKEK